MRERQAYRDRLDSLLRQIPAPTENLFLHTSLIKFACVLVCGYIEVSLRDILQEYTRRRASSEVSNYVNRRLERFQNPKMETVIQLVGAFSQDWANNLKAETKDQLKDHIDSLVANRNLIAHGKDVGLSHVRLNEYYQSALRVIEVVEEQCAAD